MPKTFITKIKMVSYVETAMHLNNFLVCLANVFLISLSLHSFTMALSWLCNPQPRWVSSKWLLLARLEVPRNSRHSPLTIFCCLLQLLLALLPNSFSASPTSIFKLFAFVLPTRYELTRTLILVLTLTPTLRRRQ